MGGGNRTQELKNSRILRNLAARLSLALSWPWCAQYHSSCRPKALPATALQGDGAHRPGGRSWLQLPRGSKTRLGVLITMDDMVRAQIRIPLGRLLLHRFDHLASLKAILSQNQVPEIASFTAKRTR
jgi:hypothetical protein